MKKPLCWTITGEFPGMKSQVLGLAEAIGFPTIHKTCNRRWPWGWLGASWGDPLKQLTSSSDSLTPPWPDIVISCGRRSAPLALAIKERTQGKTFCLHIQDPILRRSAFDLIAAPEHDNITGPNVIATKGALHKVTNDKINEGMKAYGSLFKDLPRPYNAVLLGGSTNKYNMTREAADELIASILRIRDITKGSVLVTPSFRTPFQDILRNALKSEPHIFFAEIEKVNPYLAMLGLADTLFVTGDSVNMVCEACFTGKPVYILPLLGHQRGKSLHFIQELMNENIVRMFNNKVETWKYVPFNDTEKIAAIVRQKFEDKRS